MTFDTDIPHDQFIEILLNGINSLRTFSFGLLISTTCVREKKIYFEGLAQTLSLYSFHHKNSVAH